MIRQRSRRVSASLTFAATALTSCVRHAPSASPLPAPNAAVSAQRLEARLTAFAHDSMMGREAGTYWNEKAAEYVQQLFFHFGLRPAGEHESFFQLIPNVHSRDTSAIRGVARNVVAVIRGSDPALRGEYVSITAHNDHVGYTHSAVDHDSLRAYNAVMRPMGADSRTRAPTDAELRRVSDILDSVRRVRPPRRDSVFNGADDDGSGTVALIEIAETLARARIRPRRSILFVSHSAEEAGLLGSEWFTDHPTVPLDSVVAEFDLDMVGRGSAKDITGGGPRYLEVVGLKRLSKEFGEWVEAVNAKEATPFEFNYEYDAPGHPEQYYCRADHYNYARYGIPSVSLSRGGHMDYHQLTDEPQYIDYADLARVTQFVLDAALFVANADRAPRLDAPRPTDPHVACKQ